MMAKMEKLTSMIWDEIQVVVGRPPDCQADEEHCDNGIDFFSLKNSGSRPTIGYPGASQHDIANAFVVIGALA
jgi:hypothetical protein